jgi:hypothetical protein
MFCCCKHAHTFICWNWPWLGSAAASVSACSLLMRSSPATTASCLAASSAALAALRCGKASRNALSSFSLAFSSSNFSLQGQPVQPACTVLWCVLVHFDTVWMRKAMAAWPSAPQTSPCRTASAASMHAIVVLYLFIPLQYGCTREWLLLWPSTPQTLLPAGTGSAASVYSIVLVDSATVCTHKGTGAQAKDVITDIDKVSPATAAH